MKRLQADGVELRKKAGRDIVRGGRKHPLRQRLPMGRYSTDSHGHHYFLLSLLFAAGWNSVSWIETIRVVEHPGESPFRTQRITKYGSTLVYRDGHLAS